jgi:CubicO group peptidase (beta-lactamase class C family)
MRIRRWCCASLLALFSLMPIAAAQERRDGAVYFPPADAAGGWRSLAVPQEIRRVTGVDVKLLDDAFELIQGETKNGGLLVVRRGWLVYERYFGLAHRQAAPNLASCGKSFTSIAVGMLVAERPELFPDGLEQKVYAPKYLPAEAFPLTDPRKAEIRLGQLLAMTAGIRGNNPAVVRGQEQTIDPAGPDGAGAMRDAVAFGKQSTQLNDKTLSAETLWCAPGGGYSYATSSIHLASVMLRHVSGMELQAYLQTRLAEPLEFGEWGFGYKSSRLAHTPGGGGILLHSTDMLRFLWMLRHEGKWQNKQIVPAAYVRHCGGASPFNPHYAYSLQFNVNSDGQVAAAPRDAYWKTGSGGHVLYVVPSLDLVIWKMGGRDEQYAEANTGRVQTAEALAAGAERGEWKQSVPTATGTRRVLELAVEAVVD